MSEEQKQETGAEKRMRIKEKLQPLKDSIENAPLEYLEKNMEGMISLQKSLIHENDSSSHMENWNISIQDIFKDDLENLNNKISSSELALSLSKVLTKREFQNLFHQSFNPNINRKRGEKKITESKEIHGKAVNNILDITGSIPKE